MPFSYAQYAGNGSATTFSVPFPYLLKAHVKVFTGFNILDGTFASELVDGTGFVFSSGTQVQTTVAPAVGVTLTVIRQTPSNALVVQWQDGSNLIAQDLIDSDQQNLFVVQEQQDRNDGGAAAAVAAQAAATSAATAATTATAAATAATTSAAAATASADSATAAATASTAASTAATTTANQAIDAAAAAVATANTASSNASTALSASTAASTAASNAVTTAGAAAGDASTALSTANTAAGNASTALSTANTAAGNASTALSTANTAAGNASTALSTANAADTKADQAIASVSAAVLFDLVANVAAIPASPVNDDYIEIGNSTGVESFSPLAGRPAGFVGDAGLSVRLRYSSIGSTWNWLSYFPNDSEDRYLRKADVENSVISTSTTKAAASSAVKTAYDAAVGAQSTADGKYDSGDLASQAEAEAGADAAKLMTPQRVSQAIAALASGGATGGGGDEVFVENDQVVTTTYTISAGKNASSVGPVSIDAGVIVTISANSTWVIL